MEKDGRITPEKTMEILRKAGREITRREAELILEFLYNLSNIVLENFKEKLRNEGLTEK